MPSAADAGRVVSIWYPAFTPKNDDSRGDRKRVAKLGAQPLPHNYSRSPSRSSVGSNDITRESSSSGVANGNVQDMASGRPLSRRERRRQRREERRRSSNHQQRDDARSSYTYSYAGSVPISKAAAHISPSLFHGARSPRPINDATNSTGDGGVPRQRRSAAKTRWSQGSTIRTSSSTINREAYDDGERNAGDFDDSTPSAPKPPPQPLHYKAGPWERESYFPENPPDVQYQDTNMANYDSALQALAGDAIRKATPSVRSGFKMAPVTRPTFPVTIPDDHDALPHYHFEAYKQLQSYVRPDRLQAKLYLLGGLQTLPRPARY